MTARISIDGNLVADPDFGVGDSGTSWAHLRVASHERIRRDGEWVSTDAEYYNVTLFGAAAETAANDLRKGDHVRLDGRPQLETFDRRDGTPGAAVKVYARTISKVIDGPAATTPAVNWEVTDDPLIRIDNPDDRTGPPAYEGPVSAAHTRLTPGIYPAASYGDGRGTFGTDSGVLVRVRVTGTASHIDDRGATSEQETPIHEGGPRIHHTPDATSVLGVGKGAIALHKTLKDNGFRWSPASVSWNLPPGMDMHTRSARVSELLSTVRANGRDIPVSHEPPPPSPAASQGRATAGSPPAAGPAAQTAGRSL